MQGSMCEQNGSALFESFLMGGFESASHIRRDGGRVDVAAATHHEQRCGERYTLLAGAGVRTVRDALRWYLIEREPGRYDWSSLLPLLRAARQANVQVLWDLCHWGTPEWLSPMEDRFPACFAAFVRKAVRVIVAESGSSLQSPRFYCPVNEISFWAWAGGDVSYMGPLLQGCGVPLKRQLVRASIAAIRVIRGEDPHARILQPEPLIHIAPPCGRDQPEIRYDAAQFETWDMLLGRMHPELGGSEDLVDVLGINYYWNNQWVHEAERTPPGHPKHQPLHHLLARLRSRYSQPMIISETSAEDGAAAGWLAYVYAELRQARRLGISVDGLCIYPVMDYPGWDDARHCRCGLLEVDGDWDHPRLRPELIDELYAQASHSGRIAVP